MLLTNFRHSPDDEECPVPDEVREILQEFHKELLSHCGQSCISVILEIFDLTMLYMM